MSFAPGMVGSPSNQTQRSKGMAIDVVEHVGDSDEMNEDGSDDDIRCLRAEESRSPPKTVHSSRKRKSEGRTSCNGKRQALLNWSARERRMDEDDCTMDKEDCTMDEVEDQAIDTVIGYTLECYLADLPRSMFKERMPRAIGGERIVQTCVFFASKKMLFTYLVSIFIERGLLEEGCFVKTAEIVAMTLFMLARGASYREAKDRFQHSPSIIGKYHKQVLHGPVQLSSDIVRPYQSQDEVPAEIL
ncbi:LOW QUALITY PROTEIN: hypothetical protein Cgig2_020663 [Carnegiea gigantea]|uniref:DUF8040 domain-containing protein n=1 Tax=Carnegiea gigantea TaxID=171969 RepID=A0A9Q1KG09_9CARY|nr:LOW QUALITY PROTEIN: hypothetical protein Cgig2_020663 [Carnegiea gigantea]